MVYYTLAVGSYTNQGQIHTHTNQNKKQEKETTKKREQTDKQTAPPPKKKKKNQENWQTGKKQTVKYKNMYGVGGWAVVVVMSNGKC